MMDSFFLGKKGYYSNISIKRHEVCHDNYFGVISCRKTYHVAS
jgi:hypothetical protein